MYSACCLARRGFSLFDDDPPRLEFESELLGFWELLVASMTAALSRLFDLDLLLLLGLCSDNDGLWEYPLALLLLFAVGFDPSLWLPPRLFDGSSYCLCDDG